jgi:hypothetical protein
MGEGSGHFRAALLLILAAASGSWAADATAPDELELLEFLGSWEEQDDDWLAVAIEDAESQPVEEVDMAPSGAEALGDED